MLERAADFLGYSGEGERASDAFFPYVDHIDPATMLCSDGSYLGSQGPAARKRTVAACTQCCGSRWVLQQTPDPARPGRDEIGQGAGIARSVIPRIRPPVCCVQYGSRSSNIAAIPSCIS